MMLRRTFALGSSLALLTVAGCQDQATSPLLAPSSSSASTSAIESTLLGTFSFDRSKLALPGGSQLADLSATTADRAINPKDYPSCSTDSPINAWVDADIANTLAVEPAIFTAIFARYADLVPTYEALLFHSASEPQSFGYNGEFTKTMVKAERDIKRFWDIPSADIQVLAMHGDVLLDTVRTADTYRVLLPLLGASPAQTAALAPAWARTVRANLLQSKTMDGGNYALFTFNAVSATLTPGPLRKIVMGDGILTAYDELGFGDVAPQAIFAHEFAHQIQFMKGYELPGATETTSDAEFTRYTELQADAYAAYYLTHARGATLRQKRVEQFLEVFYQIGDCSFTSGGHHGTPDQRLKAAQFGFRIANEAQKQGHILTAAEFNALWLTEFPKIIAPESTN
jgi:hypothetical protein